MNDFQGESTVVTFEVSTDAPHLFALSPYKPPGLHQGFSFLSKSICDVRQVEFARAFRLCNTTIEPITFTVPRVKTAYFQDDLFPPTKILWEPTIDSKDWLSGSKKYVHLSIEMKIFHVVKGIYFSPISLYPIF